ncbi:hypothetical protein DKX38_013366 [Salix brachista]|uniref:Serine-threonine/tyrosine-protein kinase catalytic domain-containing protein n=1 Tax=Salix brachista TaxID=2182728 RepID=A0A5N5LQZ9_9ROSI|nr:hypothetical protein DKX38_013366 [Salix brachista]
MLSEMELGGGLLYLNVADQNKGKALNWVKRYKIIIVTAEDLSKKTESHQLPSQEHSFKKGQSLNSSSINPLLLWEKTDMENKFQAGTLEELYDPNLMLHNHHDNNIQNDVTRAVHVGLQCTQETSSLRPTMSKALQMLTTEEHLLWPTNPPFIDERTMELNDT